MTPDTFIGAALIGLAVGGWVFLIVLTAAILSTARDRRRDDEWEWSE